MRRRLPGSGDREESIDCERLRWSQPRRQIDHEIAFEGIRLENVRATAVQMEFVFANLLQAVPK